MMVSENRKKFLLCYPSCFVAQKEKNKKKKIKKQKTKTHDMFHPEAEV